MSFLYTRLAAILLSLGVLSNTVQAANFSILERNPVYFNGMYENLHIKYPTTTGSWNFLSGVGSDCRERDFYNQDVFEPCDNVNDQNGLEAVKQDLIERFSWLFEGGMSFGASWTHEQNHAAAVNIALLTSRVVLISGQIERGDAERFEHFIKDNELLECLEKHYCPFNNVVALDSSGGSFTEAVEIARFINDNSFVTLLLENATCVSACSMIYLSGYTEFEGVFFPRRYAHDTARLGLHQPFIQVPERTYSGAQVNNVISIINNSLNQVIQKFADARLDIAILGEMYRTPPEEMYYLSVPEMDKIGKVFYSPVTRQQSVTRATALGLCAEIFKAKYGHYEPALLTNLTSGSDAFTTAVPHTEFACFGSQSIGGWHYRICDEDKCAITDLVETSVYSYGPTADEYNQARFEGFDLGYYRNVGMERFTEDPLGSALADSIPNSTKLRLARELANPTHQDSFYGLAPAFPAWAHSANIPEEYCGLIDMRATSNARRIQVSLNNAGFDAGTVDGSIGYRTITAIEEANTQLLGRTSKVVDTDLLLRLGIAAGELPSFMLCQ